MKANIQTRGGLKEVEILKKPFEVNGVCLFVHNYYGPFSVTEWKTGIGFKIVGKEEEIRTAIINVFERIGEERVKRTIEEAVEEHGIANKEPGMEEDH